MRIDEWMNRDITTVRPDDSLRTAMHLMRQKGIRQLLVVEGKRLVGIVTNRNLQDGELAGLITESDILQAFLQLRGKGPLDIAESVLASKGEGGTS